MEDDRKAEERRKNTERKRLQLQRMTPEQRKELFAKNSARRSAKRAAKAIAEGRTPGKPGTKALSPEEKDFCNKAKYAIWKLKNLDYVRERDVVNKRKLRGTKEGHERLRIISLSSRERNKDKIAARNKKWFLENRERHACLGRNRRARIKSVGGKHTAADIAELMKKQKGKCAWCLLSLGEGKYHVDHYVPLALGGSNDTSNLRILHSKCNLMKSKKHPADFAQQNGLLCW